MNFKEHVSNRKRIIHKETHKVNLLTVIGCLIIFVVPIVFAGQGNSTSFDGYYYQHPIFDNDDLDIGTETHSYEPPLLTYQADPDTRKNTPYICDIHIHENCKSRSGKDGSATEFTKKHDNKSFNEILKLLKSFSYKDLELLQSNLTSKLSTLREDGKNAANAANDAEKNDEKPVNHVGGGRNKTKTSPNQIQINNEDENFFVSVERFNKMLETISPEAKKNHKKDKDAQTLNAAVQKIEKSEAEAEKIEKEKEKLKKSSEKEKKEPTVAEFNKLFSELTSATSLEKLRNVNPSSEQDNYQGSYTDRLLGLLKDFKNTLNNLPDEDNNKKQNINKEDNKEKSLGEILEDSMKKEDSKKKGGKKMNKKSAKNIDAIMQGALPVSITTNKSLAGNVRVKVTVTLDDDKNDKNGNSKSQKQLSQNIVTFNTDKISPLQALFNSEQQQADSLSNASSSSSLMDVGNINSDTINHNVENASSPDVLKTHYPGVQENVGITRPDMSPESDPNVLKATDAASDNVQDAASGPWHLDLNTKQIPFESESNGPWILNLKAQMKKLTESAKKIEEPDKGSQPWVSAMNERIKKLEDSIAESSKQKPLKSASPVNETLSSNSSSSMLDMHREAMKMNQHSLESTKESGHWAGNTVDDDGSGSGMNETKNNEESSTSNPLLGISKMPSSPFGEEGYLADIDILKKENSSKLEKGKSSYLFESAFDDDAAGSDKTGNTSLKKFGETNALSSNSSFGKFGNALGLINSSTSKTGNSILGDNFKLLQSSHLYNEKANLTENQDLVARTANTSTNPDSTAAIFNDLYKLLNNTPYGPPAENRIVSFKPDIVDKNEIAAKNMTPSDKIFNDIMQSLQPPPSSSPAPFAPNNTAYQNKWFDETDALLSKLMEERKKQSSRYKAETNANSFGKLNGLSNNLTSSSLSSNSSNMTLKGSALENKNDFSSLSVLSSEYKAKSKEQEGPSSFASINKLLHDRNNNSQNVAGTLGSSFGLASKGLGTPTATGDLSYTSSLNTSAISSMPNIDTRVNYSSYKPSSPFEKLYDSNSPTENTISGFPKLKPFGGSESNNTPSTSSLFGRLSGSGSPTESNAISGFPKLKPFGGTEPSKNPYASSSFERLAGSGSATATGGFNTNIGLNGNTSTSEAPKDNSISAIRPTLNSLSNNAAFTLSGLPMTQNSAINNNSSISNLINPESLNRGSASGVGQLENNGLNYKGGSGVTSGFGGITATGGFNSNIGFNGNTNAHERLSFSPNDNSLSATRPGLNTLSNNAAFGVGGFPMNQNSAVNNNSSMSNLMNTASLSRAGAFGVGQLENNGLNYKGGPGVTSGFGGVTPTGGFNSNIGFNGNTDAHERLSFAPKDDSLSATRPGLNSLNNNAAFGLGGFPMNQNSAVNNNSSMSNLMSPASLNSAGASGLGKLENNGYTNALGNKDDKMKDSGTSGLAYYEDLNKRLDSMLTPQAINRNSTLSGRDKKPHFNSKIDSEISSEEGDFGMFEKTEDKIEADKPKNNKFVDLMKSNVSSVTLFVAGEGDTSKDIKNLNHNRSSSLMLQPNLKKQKQAEEDAKHAKNSSLTKFEKLLSLLTSKKFSGDKNWKHNTYLHLSISTFEQLFKSLIKKAHHSKHKLLQYISHLEKGSKNKKHTQRVSLPEVTEPMNPSEYEETVKFAKENGVADKEIEQLKTVNTSNYQFRRLLKLLTFKEMLKNYQNKSQSPANALFDEKNSSDVKVQASFIHKIETLLKLLAFNRIFEDFDDTDKMKDLTDGLADGMKKNVTLESISNRNVVHGYFKVDNDEKDPVKVTSNFGGQGKSHVISRIHDQVQSHIESLKEDLTPVPFLSYDNKKKSSAADPLPDNIVKLQNILRKRPRKKGPTNRRSGKNAHKNSSKPGYASKQTFHTPLIEKHVGYPHTTDTSPLSYTTIEKVGQKNVDMIQVNSPVLRSQHSRANHVHLHLEPIRTAYVRNTMFRKKHG